MLCLDSYLWSWVLFPNLNTNYFQNPKFESRNGFLISNFNDSCIQTSITLRLFRYQMLDPLNQPRFIRIFLHNVQTQKLGFIFQQR